MTRKRDSDTAGGPEAPDGAQGLQGSKSPRLLYTGAVESWRRKLEKDIRERSNREGSWGRKLVKEVSEGS